MIRENQKYFNIIEFLLDILCIVISFLVAYYIRFYIMDDGTLSLGFRQMLFPIIASIPCYLILYSLFDLYSSRRIKRIREEMYGIFISNLIGVLIVILFLFMAKLNDFSRFNLFFFFLCNTGLTISYRLAIRFLLRKYRTKGYNLKHCLIIGTAPSALALIEKIKHHPGWGYNIVGIISTDNKHQEAFAGHRILGDLAHLNEVFDDYLLDIAMIATDEHAATELEHIIGCCERAGVKTHIIPYYYKYIPARPYIDDLDGLPIIDTRHIPLDNFFKSLSKRLFDIVFSLGALIITSPLLLITALGIKLTSPGPIIFKQERVGLNRKTFDMYKFRSMRVQTDEEEADKWTTKDDPRKTAFGSFIRKTSIDELPQFINVLKGDMSVIGPRPERPYFVDKFKEEIPRYMIKHQVKPGITGWAQVNGLRGDTSIEERIEHDLYYIENWTLGLDMKIIFLTIFKGFVNKNAY